MGKGKGDSTTSEVEIPKDLRQASKALLGQAQGIGSIGFMPYGGPQVAAQTPMQNAAIGNMNSGLDAFGFNTVGPQAGMPDVVTTPNGARGYAAAPIANEAIGAIPQAQRDALMSYFIDPTTGKPGRNVAEGARKQLGGYYNPAGQQSGGGGKGGGQQVLPEQQMPGGGGTGKGGGL